MTELRGKTAVISGGAEGIGLSIARVLGGHGMNVVLADINAEQLQKAGQALQELDIPVHVASLDVAAIDQWQSVASQALARFGQVHMLVNNAGVSGTPGALEITGQEEWRWLVDVNLMGVVNGAQVMVPLMKEHQEGGWLVNVASMAGFAGLPMAAPYSATKAAVVAMTESWRAELEADNIHACVLCPGFVKSRIHESERNKPDRYEAEEGELSASAKGMNDHMESIIDAGMDPELVGRRLVEAILAKEFYVFSHPNYRAILQSRFAAVDAAFERAEQSPLLAGDVVPDVPFLV